MVTAIEVLSPWNKNPGKLNEEYRRKLKSYAASNVNIVEIDLLRSSRGRLTVSETDLPVERRAAYYVAVRPAILPEEWKIYSLGLRQPICPIHVPLRQNEPPVILELQPLIDRIYIAGGHDDIDYSKPPVPPFNAADAVWAANIIQSAKTR